MDPNSQTPPLPPVPFQQFEYSFPPLPPFPGVALPPPFPLSPPSTSLFSDTEHTNLLGFLDSFDWDFDPSIPLNIPLFSSKADQGFTPPAMPSPSLGDFIHHSPLLPLQAPPSTSQSSLPPTPSSESPTHPTLSMNALALSTSAPPSATTPTFPNTPGLSQTSPSQQPQSLTNSRTSKPLLSTPQKRLNHIMSEQKRRNTIRDGYATLEILLAPDGQPITQSTLTRGRPRAGRGRGRGKGKSGVLFRAVEYCKWMEESMDGLGEEVARLEAAVAAGGSRLYSYS